MAHVLARHTFLQGTRSWMQTQLKVRFFMLTQLAPPIPVTVIDKGKGFAIAVIDYGQEHNLIWVTALDASGEIWCAPNPRVRLQNNWTMGRSPQAETEKSA